MNALITHAMEHWPDFRFYRYSLSLTQPIRMAFGECSVKQGVLVCCEKNGARGWGDIAPLDGYSKQSYADVLRLLPDIRTNMRTGKQLPDRFPTILAGIECALAHYAAERNGRSLYLALGGFPERTHVHVARLLLGDSTESICQAVLDALKAGYATLKLKVGQLPLAEDIQRVKNVLGILPDVVRLRLDANRSWKLPDALRFSQSLDGSKIAYIEEPLAPGEDYNTYDIEQDHAWALDESLLLEEVGLPEFRRLSQLVLKPSLLGGLRITERWLDWAKQRGIGCTISSTFESGVGMCSLLALAGARAHGSPAGLDTYSYLADDVITPRVQFRNGRVAIYQSFSKSWEVDFSKLEELT